MKTARIGDITLAYEDLGATEPALLCLPGWCASQEAFRDLLPALAQRQRTLSMDWRGHGASSVAMDDFGLTELVADAIAVIEAAGVERVVPVATSHAGWVAIELRRRLEARIPGIVLIDWIVTDPPPPFLGALAEMADTSKALAVRDSLFTMWTEGVAHAEVQRFVREDMGSYSAAMWARAARVLHLYAQPADPAYLAAQESFAAAHGWFAVRRLEARSHFPTIEVPQRVRNHIESFMAATTAHQA